MAFSCLKLILRYIQTYFHGGHLEFQDGRPRYKFGIEFIDLLTIGADTKIMFPGPLRTAIFVNIDFYASRDIRQRKNKPI